MIMIGSRLHAAALATLLSGGAAGAHEAGSERLAARAETGETRVVFDRALPNVPGKSLRAVLVRYGPGGATPALLLRPARVDGLPGFVSLERGGVLQVTALDIRAGRIAGISVTRNPDKLRHVAGPPAERPPPPQAGAARTSSRVTVRPASPNRRSSDDWRKRRSPVTSAPSQDGRSKASASSSSSTSARISPDRVPP